MHWALCRLVSFAIELTREDWMLMDLGICWFLLFRSMIWMTSKMVRIRIARMNEMLSHPRNMVFVVALVMTRYGCLGFLCIEPIWMKLVCRSVQQAGTFRHAPSQHQSNQREQDNLNQRWYCQCQCRPSWSRDDKETCKLGGALHEAVVTTCASLRKTSICWCMWMDSSSSKVNIRPVCELPIWEQAWIWGMIEVIHF